MIMSEGHGSHARQLQVSQVASLTGVTGEAIRYYTRIGLLHPERDENNGYRYFSDADVELVGFVRKGQSLGLTLRQIREILALVEHGERPCARVRELVAARTVQIEAQIDQLTEVKARLEATLERWQGVPDDDVADSSFCPLIERTALDDRA